MKRVYVVPKVGNGTYGKDCYQPKYFHGVIDYDHCHDHEWNPGLFVLDADTTDEQHAELLTHDDVTWLTPEFAHARLKRHA